MYKKVELSDTIEVPPEELGEVTEDVVLRLLQDEFEGTCDENVGWIVAVTDLNKTSEGKILYNKGGVFYNAEFEAIVFEPIEQEIIEGLIKEIVEFGAFVGIGPIDALLHASQIGDDFFSFDEENERLHGSDSNKGLGVGDKIRARIVNVSIDPRKPEESKIGLTMRQVGLGKEGWLEEEREKQKQEH